MSSRVHGHVMWPWPYLPTHTNPRRHTMTHIFVPHTSVATHSPTHTHTPFSFSPKTIVLASHFHMCVGHKTAKGRLKASLSWLAGSQFVSHKHRTHLSPTVFTYPSDPHTSQCALLSTDTGYSLLNVSKDDCRSLTFSSRRAKESNTALLVVLF